MKFASSLTARLLAGAALLLPALPALAAPVIYHLNFSFLDKSQSSGDATVKADIDLAVDDRGGDLKNFAYVTLVSARGSWTRDGVVSTITESCWSACNYNSTAAAVLQYTSDPMLSFSFTFHTDSWEDATKNGLDADYEVLFGGLKGNNMLTLQTMGKSDLQNVSFSLTGPDLNWGDTPAAPVPVPVPDPVTPPSNKLPEPGGLSLACVALVALGALRRRRQGLGVSLGRPFTA